MSIEIRKELPGDIEAIRYVNDKAFRRTQEGHVVDRLRNSCREFLSLVALIEKEIVGHILFTPAVIEQSNGVINGRGLAPLAVLPKYQKQGIGSKLVEAGLAMIKQKDCAFIIVVGHANYYPRFGFQPGSRFNLTCQWDHIPDEMFMTMIFDEAKMNDVAGIAKYRSEFDICV